MRKQSLTYQRKFLFLSLGLMVLVVLAYYLSISRTIEQLALHGELSRKVTQVQDVERDLSKLKAQRSELPQHVGDGQVALGDFNHQLLHTVGQFCEKNDLLLADFAEPKIGVDKGYEVETGILTIGGDYKKLLQLVALLQRDFKMGSVVSIDFVKEKNYRKNVEELFVKVYVQKISKHESI